MRQSDWYKHVWTLNAKNQPWTENTEHQVNFIVNKLALKGNERILDLACGYGRHSIALARMGFSVTGVDITEAYIEDAKKTAKELSLEVEFIHADIRDVACRDEFDVVLNLDDGAIGYLEDDDENLKIFDVISKALKTGGKHFMGINNADYADRCFPSITCEIGENALTIWQNDWDAKTRILTLGAHNIRYGEIAQKPHFNMENAHPMRLYSLDELARIFQQRGMKIIASYSNYSDNESTDKEEVLNVYSIKEYC